MIENGIFGRSLMVMAVSLAATALPVAAQTAGRAPAAGAQAGVAPAAAVRGYQIGPNDALQVIIYGQPEAGITTRVKADGTIVMPFIGKLQVNGLDNVQLADLITERMVSGGFLRDPVVNVEITQYVSRSVNVAGTVAQPGIVALDRPLNALEVLLKSGWTRADSADYVYLRRAGQAERKLDVESLVRGDESKNPIMAAGDTLFVPGADKFYIYGQINQPGVLPIVPGMTIQQAMILAGGVTATGSSGKVGLVRGDEKEKSVDVSEKIQRNDVIIVKERFF